MPALSPCLPVDFQFSQASLRDFQECPRKFLLRYLEKRPWPAVVSEPALEHERQMLRGAAFHRMVQQHLAGIDPKRLTEMLQNPALPPGGEILCEWWENYLSRHPADQPGQRYVEHARVTRLAGYRLFARYDVLIVHQMGDQSPLHATILDWKTGSRPIHVEKLLTAPQTRVYRTVLSLTGSGAVGGALPPEKIEMVYWFAAEPDLPLKLPYSQALFDDDLRVLTDWIADIARRKPDQFDQSPQGRTCQYCIYRSLCGRGTRAGDLAGLEEDGEEMLPDTFDAIEEIAF